jgi:hypothetical protein
MKISELHGFGNAVMELGMSIEQGFKIHKHSHNIILAQLLSYSTCYLVAFPGYGPKRSFGDEELTPLNGQARL